MQKYRVDRKTTQSDGAVIWCAEWMGGPSLARINNCRWASLANEPRVTVYITGEPDTAFSQPAVCSYRGKRVRGYVTSDGDRAGQLVFRHTYF